jgi:peptidoglycan/xylan/chitin deacetylase (PgdA/CDA1 family)
MKYMLLSFDLEEFDLPLEYSQDISKDKQFKVALSGLEHVLKLLKKYEARATFFVTASFSLRYPKVIRELSRSHEIAAHGLDHSDKDFNGARVAKSKKIIEGIIKKEVKGFRSQRLKEPNFGSLKRSGFLYDSSICPTYLPGRYQHYFEKREVNLRKGILNVPISTFPIIRMPLYWLFFRFFGIIYSKIITSLCMRYLGFTNIFFHPWEFSEEVSEYKTPFYIKNVSGKEILRKLEKYISWCQKEGFKFTTFSEFLEKGKVI